MWIYTQEVRDFERLKRLMALSLECNGFKVTLNPNKKHQLFEGQDRYEAPMHTIIMRTEKTYINWSKIPIKRIAKWFVDREDGYGKVHIPDDLLDELIKELELRKLIGVGGENARTEEGQSSYQ